MPARPHPSHLRARPSDTPGHLERHRLALSGGVATTLHVARHVLARTAPRVVRLRGPEPLEAWCRRRGVAEAIVGGFFVRPEGMPLGELRTRGIARRHVAFLAPWHATRASFHVHGGRATIAPRCEIAPEPRGDLLQAGPLLVRHGAPAVGVTGDPEGFSAGMTQFDSDITDGRYPRAALALAGGELLAVACDGRADDEAGLTLRELAEALVALGADAALNLDGGGSTSLVCAGELRNVPREAHGVAIAGGRPITSAIVFGAR